MKKLLKSMRTTLHIGMGFCLLLILAGCSGVTSKYPIGNTPADLDPEEWDGTWISAEGAALIEVLEPEQGIIQIGWIDTEEEEWQLRTVICTIMEGREWEYWNMPLEDDGTNGEYYLWGRIEKKEREIIVWMPDTEAFREAIESQTIQGEIDEGEQKDSLSSPPMLRFYTVKLHDTPERIVEFLESSAGCSCFEWEDPFVIRKLGE